MSQTPRSSELISAFAREFAAAVGAMAGGAGTLESAERPDDAPRWLVVVSVSGADRGQVIVGIGERAARDLTRRIMGLDEAPEDGVVIDTLQEFGGQAAGALSQETVAAGLKFDIALADAPGPAPDEAAAFSIPLGDETSAGFVVWGAVETVPGAAEAGQQAIEEDRVIPSSQRGSGSSSVRPGAPDNLDVILDIDLPITVRFGSANLSLQELTRLGAGSVIDLGRSPDDPVELLVSGKVVARGEVVVVSGNYGVRIFEVVSTAERIRSMGA